MALRTVESLSDEELIAGLRHIAEFLKAQGLPIVSLMGDTVTEAADRIETGKEE